MRRVVTFKGKELSLFGRRVKEGMSAPEFKLVDQQLREVRLSDFKGKTKVINFFPSLDTPVCDLQVKEFNKKAAGLGTDIVVIGISKDLPFAQSRFCSSNGIENEVVLSDYRYSSFAIQYGLLIKELNLLARGALIIDKHGIIRYMQLAKEITSPLDYHAVFKALEETLKRPAPARRKGLFCGFGRCR